MHAANLKKSNRLQRVYACLQDGPKTTRALIQEAGVCAVNSIVAELRDNGIPIRCRCLRPGVYEYRLFYPDDR